MIGIRSAFSIRARGHRPHLEAVYMTAPRSVCRNTKKALPTGGRPYTRPPAASRGRIHDRSPIRLPKHQKSLADRGPSIHDGKIRVRDLATGVVRAMPER